MEGRSKKGLVSHSKIDVIYKNNISLLVNPAKSRRRTILGEGKTIVTGRKIAHYEILEEIGSGGMAVVYKAKDLRLGRLVALKVLNERFRRDVPSLQRFQREAQLTSSTFLDQ